MINKDFGQSIFTKFYKPFHLIIHLYFMRKYLRQFVGGISSWLISAEILLETIEYLTSVSFKYRIVYRFTLMLLPCDMNFLVWISNEQCWRINLLECNFFSVLYDFQRYPNWDQSMMNKEIFKYIRIYMQHSTVEIILITKEP